MALNEKPGLGSAVRDSGIGMGCRPVPLPVITSS